MPRVCFILFVYSDVHSSVDAPLSVLYVYSCDHTPCSGTAALLSATAYDVSNGHVCGTVYRTYHKRVVARQPADVLPGYDHSGTSDTQTPIRNEDT